MAIRVRLFALLCCAAAALGAPARPKRVPDPPTVADHVEWYRALTDGRRPEVQMVRIVTEAGESMLWRKMPPKRRGREPFHYRILRPNWNGIAYYAWKTGLIDASLAPDGSLVLTKAPKRAFWRRLM
jgi:hypothetical protein